MSAIAPVLSAIVEEILCVNCGDVVKTPTVTEFELGAVRGVNKMLLRMMFTDMGKKMCDGCHKPFIDPIIARLSALNAAPSVPIIAEKASDNDAKPLSPATKAIVKKLKATLSVPVPVAQATVLVAPIVQPEIAPEPAVVPAITEPVASVPDAPAEKPVIETKKYAAPKPAEASKPEAKAEEPKAEKPKFSGVAKVVMSIIDNDGTVRGGSAAEKTMTTDGGIKLTKCIVALNDPSACICGGWNQWDVMPAIRRRLGRPDKTDPSFGFGPACAQKATAEFLAQKNGVDPFKSGLMLDVAILGYKSNPQVPFTAPAVQTSATTVAKPVAAADVGYDQLAKTFGVKQPVMGDFKSVQEAFGRTALLAGISRTLNGEFVKNPSGETLAKMIEELEKLVFNGAVQTVSWGKITPEAVRRLSSDALAFSLEARSIASRMTVQPPVVKVKPFKVLAPIATPPAAPKQTAAAKKAARSAADIALRESMRSKKGEQGGKKGGNKK